MLTILPGPHKTASSSVQAALERHRTALWREDGVLVCDDFEGEYMGAKRTANLGFGFAAPSSARHAAHLAALARCMRRGANDTLLASEELDQPYVDPRAFRAYPRVRAIVAVRPLSAWIASYWTQVTRSAAPPGPDAPLDLANVCAMAPATVAARFRRAGVPVTLNAYDDHRRLFCDLLRSRVLCGAAPVRENVRNHSDEARYAPLAARVLAACPGWRATAREGAARAAPHPTRGGGERGGGSAPSPRM